MKMFFLLICLLCIGCHSSIQIEDLQDNSFSFESQEDGQKLDVHLSKLLLLHNQNREYKGRAGLELDQFLVDYAQKYAEIMAKRNRLEHSDISILIQVYMMAGENIAYNQITEEEVVMDWMNSSGHRENIMNRNFSKVGFGKAVNSYGNIYWCTVFAG